jgi:iron complex transport system substrate-binding protein
VPYWAGMRIASLVPSATEMLFALGLGDRVVAVTHECDHPPRARSLPHLTRTVLAERLNARQIDTAVKATVGEGRALYELDEERLAAVGPDLIVTQAICDVCAVSYDDVLEVARRLPSRPEVLQQDPSTLGEMLEDVIRLGEATGLEAAAHEMRGELEGRLAAVRAAVSGASRPRVIALEWLDPPFVGGHWIPEMISIAGGEDVAGPPGLKSPEVQWGELSGLGPDVVIAMPCGWYVEESRAQAIERWERIATLGAGRVFAVDAASTFSRPGPRLVDGVELLGHLLHPDLVDPPGNIGFAEVRAPTGRPTASESPRR